MGDAEASHVDGLEDPVDPFGRAVQSYVNQVQETALAAITEFKSEVSLIEGAP